MAAYDVIVVGCGITGASTAYHLARRGVGRVLLLDRDKPAAGGTGKSAALVRQHYSTPLMARLALAGVGMFARMADELGQDGGYRRVGWAFFVPPDALAAAQRNLAMQQRVGVATRILDDAEITANMPWLNRDGLAAVVWEQEGGYADPVRATEAYVAAFQRHGGEFRAKTPVRALRRNGDRIDGIVTDAETIAAGAVVNAAGPWAPRLAASAGIELTMRVLREQDTVWQVPAGRAMPECAISNAVDATYLRPLGHGRFLLGRGFPKPYEDCDPENYKQTADESFIAEVQARADLRFPPFQGAKLVTAYTALYDVTPDWYPFVGPRAGLSGYFDASGGSGHGFKIGPAIGRELAGWIIDGRSSEDFAALSYDRVAQGRLFQQAYGGNRG
jgi:glycine/D-amino acid oxidase-like deaminating enzyme